MDWHYLILTSDDQIMCTLVADFYADVKSERMIDNSSCIEQISQGTIKLPSNSGIFPVYVFYFF